MMPFIQLITLEKDTLNNIYESLPFTLHSYLDWHLRLHPRSPSYTLNTTTQPSHHLREQKALMQRVLWLLLTSCKSCLSDGLNQDHLTHHHQLLHRATQCRTDRSSLSRFRRRRGNTSTLVLIASWSFRGLVPSNRLVAPTSSLTFDDTNTENYRSLYAFCDCFTAFLVSQWRTASVTNTSDFLGCVG